MIKFNFTSTSLQLYKHKPFSSGSDEKTDINCCYVVQDHNAKKCYHVIWFSLLLKQVYKRFLCITIKQEHNRVWKIRPRMPQMQVSRPKHKHTMTFFSFDMLSNSMWWATKRLKIIKLITYLKQQMTVKTHYKSTYSLFFFTTF